MSKSPEYRKKYGAGVRNQAAIASDIDFLNSIGPKSPLDDILPPPGRAPKGLGTEYADRRAIHSTLQDQMGNRTKLQTFINESRGAKVQGWRLQVAKERVSILNDAIGASLQIAGNDMGDWSFKRAMIKDVIDYARAISPDY